MTIDYRKILKAYIDHVGSCEGIDFLDFGSPAQPWPELTAEETAALCEVAAEVDCTDVHRQELLRAAKELRARA